MTKRLSAQERHTANFLRMHRHIHNALTGDMAMIKAIVNKVRNSQSTTTRAKELASKLDGIRVELTEEIYNYRVEPDGRVVVPTHKVLYTLNGDFDDFI